jgi:hypothetical protein
MDSLLGQLVRRALRRGLAGEHWAWFVLAATAFLLRRARRPDRHAGFTVGVEEGQRYEVSLTPRPGKGHLPVRRF